MAHRKLQQEVDKVFKKINEGLETFDTYYERHDACTNNPPQKDKLENDLKREVKKLQRLREQIKSWQSSPDVKDKDALLSHRRAVEVAMEKYKVVEKASKEKAYSNTSLKRSDTLDPAESKRLETSEYLSSQIEELERQYDLLQLDIDQLFALNKKKKTYSAANEDKINKLKELQSRYRWHEQQMEIALRLLANEELDPERVDNIKEDIMYFVESNKDEGFMEDESIYDSLDLDSNEAIAHEVSQAFAQRASASAHASKAAAFAAAAALDPEAAAKMSKKEQRRLEREAKKAAKLAAKNAAAQSVSEGPTISIKLDPTPKGASPTLPSASLNVSESNSPTPTQKPTPISKVNTSTTNSEKLSTPTPSRAVPNTVTYKPVTVPARPAGDLKWSDAAALNMDHEKKTLTDGTVITPAVTADSRISSTANTPMMSTPTLLSQTEKTKSAGLESLSQTTSHTAAAAAAVLAAGAAAVNQNNQQFHKNSPVPVSTDAVAASGDVSDPVRHDSALNADVGDISMSVDGSLQDSNEPTASPEQPEPVPTAEDEQEQEDEDEEANLPLDASMSCEDDMSPNGHELEPLPAVVPLTAAEEAARNITKESLEATYSDDFSTIGLPSGIKEFMMGYEVYNNNLSPNNGRLGGFRRSVDFCNIERLYDIPQGVNPPNPLDAFRSSQQWDHIRCGINPTLTADDVETVVKNFRDLEMFSLFYNYYFAVTPLEKKLALLLLKERNWKVARGEAMWFLGHGEPKVKTATFEIGDYKIFKLDDWSVIDKTNFRLDYANLMFFEPAETPERQLSTDQLQAGEIALEDELSHGQQLLQQLKVGRP